MFQKIQKTIGVSDFRMSIAKYLKRAEAEPLIISTNRGEESFVVLSAHDYNVLVERREDEMDARELSRLVSKKQKRVTWDKVR